MYALVGHFVEVYQPRIGESFVSEESEEIVALFFNYDDAAEYERRSRLAQPQLRTFASDRVYRRRSLLSECEDAHIEDYEEPSYPVDPVI